MMATRSSYGFLKRSAGRAACTHANRRAVKRALPAALRGPAIAPFCHSTIRIVTIKVMEKSQSGTSLAEHRALGDLSRVAILEELRTAGQSLDASELAGRVGLHYTTVRSHLTVLLKAGLVKAETARRETPGRPRIVYRPVEGARPVDSDGLGLLARVLTSYVAASSPDPKAAAIEAGHRWGRYLVERPEPSAGVTQEDALRQIREFLDKLGFEPEAEPIKGAERVRLQLHHCPFGDLALSHPEIACSVHLGLIRGALEEIQAPIDVASLDRFVRPSVCVACLQPARADHTPRSPKRSPHRPQRGGKRRTRSAPRSQAVSAATSR
ncbi:MAG: helix-turn-helix transcriptional regulator [Candidatus Dormibacteraceae bacterium]